MTKIPNRERVNFCPWKLFSISEESSVDPHINVTHPVGSHFRPCLFSVYPLKVSSTKTFCYINYYLTTRWSGTPRSRTSSTPRSGASSTPRSWTCTSWSLLYFHWCSEEERFTITEKILNSEHFPLKIFPAIYDNWRQLIYFTLEAYIASTMNPDQTAP